MDDTADHATVIVPYLEIEPAPGVIAALDEIFFEASATKSFADEAARASFRYRWLGSYLTLAPAEAFIALGPNGLPVGYVIGGLADPASDARYRELGYFAVFAPLTRQFPAHLHINLAPSFRSHGLGTRLIERFARHAKEQGAKGLHVVTGKGMRNVSFYLKNGFSEVAQTMWNGRPLLMLGRRLD
ncbi:MAG: GNAT family N-acetyltransferase [Hyphomicrobiaceae bacterium]